MAKRPEIRLIISEKQQGKNNSFYGKTHTAEAIEKIKRKVECPYCDKVGGIGIMQRWHFEKCKNK